MNELQEFFSAGDADLRATAGQPGTLVRRRSGERLPLTAVVAPADVGLVLASTTGAAVQCELSVIISRSECTRRPDIGDVIEFDTRTYEIQRITDWVYDTSWHVDVALKKQLR